MKAEDNAPSPKSLRKRLGIVKPIIKAELKAFAPIVAKKTTSRIRPVIRDNTVVKLTEAIFFKCCLTKLFSYKLKCDQHKLTLLE